MITIATAIPHTPWRPDRVESLERQRQVLACDDVGPSKLFTERAPLHVWSHDMWRWGQEQDCDWFLEIQDDVIPCADFYAALRAMLASAPGGIVALHSAHPAAKALARQGHRWCSTADGMIGTAYCLSREVLGYFLSWRHNSIRQGGAEAITEDTLLGCYALATRRKIYHPIPTLIDHDLTVDSNFTANAGHPFKRPVVTALRDLDVLGIEPAHLQDPDFWSTERWEGGGKGEKIRHLGRLWGATPDLCARWVKGFTPAQYEEAVQDACPAEHSRFLR